MSLVNRVGRPAVPWAGRASEGAKGGFSVPTEEAAGKSGAAAVSAPLRSAALAGVLMLQERTRETIGDRHARRRAKDLLQALSRIQRAMLENSRDEQSLQDLAGLIDDLPCATDPGVRGILQAIAVRARVELARHGF